MTKGQLIVELKDYCEHEYNLAKNSGYDIQSSITRCYGAVMFAINISNNFDAETGKWWDDEMLPKFRKLEIGE